MYEGGLKPRSSTKYFRKPSKLWVPTPLRIWELSRGNSEWFKYFLQAYEFHFDPSTLNPSSFRNIFGITVNKAKQGYSKWRVIKNCSIISETTRTSELNVGGYNLRTSYNSRIYLSK